MAVSRQLRDLVRTRAGLRCEYCQIHEDDEYSALEVEHIVPDKHGGLDVEQNLAINV